MSGVCLLYILYIYIHIVIDYIIAYFMLWGPEVGNR